MGNQPSRGKRKKKKGGLNSADVSEDTSSLLGDDTNSIERKKSKSPFSRFKKKKQRYDNNIGDVDNNAEWIMEDIALYIRSEDCSIFINTFIDENCLFFDHSHEFDVSNDILKVQTDLHEAFKDLVENLLQKRLNQLGVSDAQFREVCNELNLGQFGQFNDKIKLYISAIDNFTSFKKIMAQRNNELEAEALRVMKQSIGVTDVTQLTEEEQLAWALHESAKLASEQQSENPSTNNNNDINNNNIEQKNDQTISQPSNLQQQPTAPVQDDLLNLDAAVDANKAHPKQTSINSMHDQPGAPGYAAAQDTMQSAATTAINDETNPFEWAQNQQEMPPSPNVNHHNETDNSVNPFKEANLMNPFSDPFFNNSNQNNNDNLNGNGNNTSTTSKLKPLHKLPSLTRRTTDQAQKNGFDNFDLEMPMLTARTVQDIQARIAEKSQIVPGSDTKSNFLSVNPQSNTNSHTDNSALLKRRILQKKILHKNNYSSITANSDSSENVGQLEPLHKALVCERKFLCVCFVEFEKQNYEMTL